MKLRRILICLLALLTASVGLASVIAQAQSESPESVEKRARSSEAFVIYVNALGDVECRPATLVERELIARREGDPRTIYGGAPRTRTLTGQIEETTPNALVTSALPALQPSAGLHIILHGTTQLNDTSNADAVAAKNAFIVAANRWEAVISTPITVVLDVDYGPNFFGQAYPSPNILGQTGTSRSTSNLSTVRGRLLAKSPTTSEQAIYNALPTSTIPIEFNGATSNVGNMQLARPLARALDLAAAISNPDSLPIGQADAGIGFNSAFSFDFNPDDGISSGKTDFDSVVTHEIGHALGFISRAGDSAAPTRIEMWDLFRFRPGVTAGTFASAARVMSAGGEQVFFNNLTNTFGTQELALSTGGPTGDATGGDGNQSSHWKADEQTGRYIGIMDPTLSRGTRKTLTNNDLNAIDTLGYSIGGNVPPPPAPPSNDLFANSFALSSANGALTGDSTGATKEPGEPQVAGNQGGGSVWYVWTAPASGTATFDTVGSGIDTLLGIYTGSAVNALNLLGSNDDIVLGQNTDSRVTFTATAGVTYHIVVDGFNGETGNFQLNWSGPAPTPTPTPTPTPQQAIVSGRVVEGTQGLQGVLVGLFQGPLLQQTTTGADGRWSFGNTVVGQSYSISFLKSGYRFTPSGQSFFVNTPTQDMGDALATKGNSIDASDFFVTKHYEDFLGRQPDSSGLNFWTNSIESCGLSLQCREAKRIDTSAAFFLSIEFQNTGYLVERMYKVAYGDTAGITRFPGFPLQISVPVIRRSEFIADSAIIRNNLVVGPTGWEQLLENNKNAFALAFVGRQRFIDAYPLTMTPSQFVAKLNQNTGGALTQAEVNALVAELSGNSTATGRASVFRKVAENAEVDRREKNRAFVLMQFFGYLQRDPDAAPDTDHTGWKFWLDKLDQFGGDFRSAEMVKAFISSTEYRQRFGQP